MLDVMILLLATCILSTACYVPRYRYWIIACYGTVPCSYHRFSIIISSPGRSTIHKKYIVLLVLVVPTVPQHHHNNERTVVPVLCVSIHLLVYLPYLSSLQHVQCSMYYKYHTVPGTSLASRVKKIWYRTVCLMVASYYYSIPNRQ